MCGSSQERVWRCSDPLQGSESRGRAGTGRSQTVGLGSKDLVREQILFNFQNETMRLERSK